MSKEIKNTLFRFVTARVPELAEDKSKNFIYYPDNMVGSAYESILMYPALFQKSNLINSITRSLRNDSLKTRDEVRAYVGGQFYEFALWLKSNRKTITVAEVDEKGLVDKISSAKEIKVWDDLLYQIKTYQSSYVREALFTMLGAQHFLKSYKSDQATNDICRQLAQAKVVIQKEIYGNEVVTGNFVRETKIDTTVLDRELDAQVLRDEITLYEQIKKESQKQEDTYRRLEQNRFDLKYRQYQVNLVAAKKNAQTTQQTYTDPVTGIEESVIRYTNLEVPNFQFEAEQEISILVPQDDGPRPQARSSVQVDVTPVTSADFINEINTTQGFTKFSETQHFIDEQINKATEALFEVSTLERQVVNYNGALIPIQETAAVGAVFSVLC